jgi:hypothetical protein
MKKGGKMTKDFFQLFDRFGRASRGSGWAEHGAMGHILYEWK